MNGVNYHLVTYYLLQDLQRGMLQEISSRPDIVSIDIDESSIIHVQCEHSAHGKKSRGLGQL